MRSLIAFDVVTDRQSLVMSIDERLLLHAQIRRRLMRFVPIADQFEIPLPENGATSLPILGGLNAVEQIVPTRLDNRRIGAASRRRFIGGDYGYS
jgi:hypothetical protein